MQEEGGEQVAARRGRSRGGRRQWAVQRMVFDGWLWRLGVMLPCWRRAGERGPASPAARHSLAGCKCAHRGKCG